MKIEQIQNSIQKTSSNLTQIKSLQSRILQATTPDESTRLTSHLDALTESTSSRIQSIRKRMKRLAAETSKLPPGAETHMRKGIELVFLLYNLSLISLLEKGQQAAIAKKMLAVAEEYQKLQSDFKTRYKSRMESEIRIGKQYFDFFNSNLVYNLMKYPISFLYQLSLIYIFMYLCIYIS